MGNNGIIAPTWVGSSARSASLGACLIPSSRGHPHQLETRITHFLQSTPSNCVHQKPFAHFKGFLSWVPYPSARPNHFRPCRYVSFGDMLFLGTRRSPPPRPTPTLPLPHQLLPPSTHLRDGPAQTGDEFLVGELALLLVLHCGVVVFSQLRFERPKNMRVERLQQPGAFGRHHGWPQPQLHACLEHGPGNLFGIHFRKCYNLDLPDAQHWSPPRDSMVVNMSRGGNKFAYQKT